MVNSDVVLTFTFGKRVSSDIQHLDNVNV